ncbi:hypothetical protein [Shewanella vaxholmensis]|uniref:hypothetical protein n=1 Tax=Shewanella vaxholmensis TaxID=3063535 RepID=UPI00318C0CE4
MSKFETILLGIPSGIVSAFIVWITMRTWASTFTPWIRKQIYKGVEVQGQWTAVVMKDGDRNDIVDIENAVETITYVLNIDNQYGHVVTGWFSQDHKCAETESHGRFNFRGQIMDGVLMLSLTPSLKSKSTFGTLLMYVVSAGSRLEGKFTYKGAKTNQINSIDIVLDKRV